jgi:hypothetical protein
MFLDSAELYDAIYHFKDYARECKRLTNIPISWMAEETGMPTGDLMVGSGGLTHFLLRLSCPDLHLGFPLLLPSLQ